MHWKVSIHGAVCTHQGYIAPPPVKLDDFNQVLAQKSPLDSAVLITHDNMREEDSSFLSKKSSGPEMGSSRQNNWLQPPFSLSNIALCSGQSLVRVGRNASCVNSLQQQCQPPPNAHRSQPVWVDPEIKPKGTSVSRHQQTEVCAEAVPAVSCTQNLQAQAVNFPIGLHT